VRPLPGTASRYAVAAVASLALVAVSCREETPRRADERAPVILLLVDTLRADYLGSYGFEGPISPCLDGLARESVRFTRAFSQAPWTKPSVATIFTSLHPHVHGVTNHKGGRFGAPDAFGQIGILPERAVTLAELMRAGGYATAGFIANPWVTEEYGFRQGFDAYDDSFADTHVDAEPVLERASAWLRSRPRGRPFFLYLHFMDVHGPYAAPDGDYAALLDSPGLGDGQRLSEAQWQEIPDYLRRPEWVERPEARELTTWRARYGAGVRSFDRQLCGFLDVLRSEGVFDGSYLWVTSDHGEELFEHGGWGHGTTLYDDQTHVPLLVRLPGGRGGGRRVDEMVGLIDLLPTILRSAGLGVPDDAQGRDRTPALEGGADDGPGYAISSATEEPGQHGLRTARHKLLFDRERGSVRLFDLEVDPEETVDVASSSPAVVRELMAPLERYLREAEERGAFAVEAAPPSEEMLERLRALGYAE
jgi:arylsulfatase A-like enzyme